MKTDKLVIVNGIEIKFYDLLRKDLHLSDDRAAAFVEVLGDVVEFELKKEKQASATKQDIHQLSLKIDTNTSSAKDDIYQVKEDIHKFKIKLEQSKVDIYKAMFWTGTVQLLAILGGVVAIVKFASS